MGAAGGPGSVAVFAAAGCSWTAISNAPWIRVTSGAAGSGNGAVNFVVNANTDTVPQREASLLIHTLNFNN